MLFALKFQEYVFTNNVDCDLNDDETRKVFK